MSSASQLIGLNGKKPPAVFWRRRSKQYMSYIGFRAAQKGKRVGQRVRAGHYLGKDLREATLNAILIDRRWDQVVIETKRRAKLCEPAFGERVKILPVWPTEAWQRRRELTASELEDSGMLIHLPAEEGDESKPFLTVRQLGNNFLDAQKARVGLQGRRGLKPGTYAQLVRNLNSALKGIDTTINALELGRNDCRKLVDYWLSPERQIAERTAGNYCKAFLQMLIWAENEEVAGFVKPRVGGLFNFANTRGEIQRFDPERMIRLLAHATERCKLYVLIGLNTGFTQVDIANLTKDEIVQLNGETFVVRRREKSSHQNDFRTQHYIWPETAALLRKHLAPDNAENLALLNVNGRKLKWGKTDNIRDSIDEVREASGVDEVTFKQFRKFGVTAIKRLTLNQEVARMYAAQRIAGVLSCYDRDDFFEPLTAALKRWREELVSQGVL